MNLRESINDENRREYYLTLLEMARCAEENELSYKHEYDFLDDDDDD
jgi:hypothetical protein